MAEHLVVLQPAEADLAEACDWYDSQETGLSVDFLRDVTKSFDSIREFPEMFEVVRGRYRRAITKRFPYVIYFKVELDFCKLRFDLGEIGGWRSNQLSF